MAANEKWAYLASSVASAAKIAHYSHDVAILQTNGRAWQTHLKRSGVLFDLTA
jgi:hypothetical protein